VSPFHYIQVIWQILKDVAHNDSKSIKLEVEGKCDALLCLSDYQNTSLRLSLSVKALKFSFVAITA